MTKIFAAFGIILLAILAGGWSLMLLVGLIHDWRPLVPTMPYSVALVLCTFRAVSATLGQFVGGMAKEAVK